MGPESAGIAYRPPLMFTEFHVPGVNVSLSLAVS